MENTPSAPTEAPQAPASEKTPTTNERAQAAAPIDLGLTAEQAEQFKTFMANNGGFDVAFKKLKTDISAPKSAQPTEPQPAQTQTQTQTQAPAPDEPAPKTPEGAITAQEFLAQQYFRALAKEEKYAPIADGIKKGDYLNEMAAFGVNTFNPDGSINDKKVRMYLDLKAQTVPAQTTSTEPDASTAPTVEYYQVAGDKITDITQAYAIIQQDAQLKNAGMAGHPLSKDAEDFIRNSFAKK